MDRTELGDFLRRRRALLQPQDVEMTSGARRRTPGLRREEVAWLTGMSPDYYLRLEQARGPQPSTQMLSALARALRLTLDERDHLFHLGGHAPPVERSTHDHVRPGLLRLLDALTATPAQVIADLGQVLAQNAMAVALLGDHTSFTGPARSFIYRWFTDPTARDIYPAADHAYHSRVLVADLRAAVGARPRDPPPPGSSVTCRRSARSSASSGASTRSRLLVFTARPGSAASRKLELLGALGQQHFSSTTP